MQSIVKHFVVLNAQRFCYILQRCPQPAISFNSLSIRINCICQTAFSITTEGKELKSSNQLNSNYETLGLDFVNQLDY